MIRTTELTKIFDGYKALDAFSSTIPDGSIYGLVGSNGSGKSTLLRLLSGIYYPDAGKVEIDGEEPFENTGTKSKVFHVADDLYFLPQSNMDEMAAFYARMYTGFDAQVYAQMKERFPIDSAKRINTFSKGMKRQVSLILALSARPQVLLLDEAFDGLDPVIRSMLRKILADQIAERNMTVIIASHNLRELEDLCDCLGLLHQGRIVFQKEIDEVKLGFCKVQAGFRQMPSVDTLREKLQIMQLEQAGSVLNMVVRGTGGEILSFLDTLDPLFAETVPLTLEEVFIHEMEVVGYDYNKIIF